MKQNKMNNHLSPQVLGRKTYVKQSMTNPNGKQSMTNPAITSYRNKSSIGVVNSPKNNQNKSDLQQPKSKKPQTNQQTILCTQHNQCQFKYKERNPASSQDSYFSIDSQFLNEQRPIQIDIQPQIQLQVRPQIDVLIATNIRMNKYKETYKKIQKYEQLKLRQQLLKKVEQSAKSALLKTKTQNENHKNKWGHSIYSQSQKKQEPPSEKNVQKQVNPTVQKQEKSNLQNATQKAALRIRQYKQKQLIRQKQHQKKSQSERQKKLDQQKLQQVKQKITENANRILQSRQREVQQVRKRKQQIKRKISQIQKESLNNCKRSRKNPLKNVEDRETDMQMADSQYSTFQARKEGRKMVKKGKKKKNQIQSRDDSELFPEPDSRKHLQRRMSKTTTDISKENKAMRGPASDKQNIVSKENQNQQQNNKIEFKKFYVWNIPIRQEDYSLFALKKQFQQGQQNYQKKAQKSFNQEAQQYLAQKNVLKFQQQRKKTRQQYFQQKVQQKKKQLIMEYQEMYGNK